MRGHRPLLDLFPIPLRSFFLSFFLACPSRSSSDLVPKRGEESCRSLSPAPLLRTPYVTMRWGPEHREKSMDTHTHMKRESWVAAAAASAGGGRGRGAARPQQCTSPHSHGLFRRRRRLPMESIDSLPAYSGRTEETLGRRKTPGRANRRKKLFLIKTKLIKFVIKTTSDKTCQI